MFFAFIAINIDVREFRNQHFKIHMCTKFYINQRYGLFGSLSGVLRYHNFEYYVYSTQFIPYLILNLYTQSNNDLLYFNMPHMLLA